MNKEKTIEALLPTGNPIASAAANIPNGFIHSISDPGSPVKMRISSVTETQQFRRWFKGSKVVDADGNPLVVYHGIDTDFTVFDHSKGRSTKDTLVILGVEVNKDNNGGRYYVHEAIDEKGNVIIAQKEGLVNVSDRSANKPNTVTDSNPKRIMSPNLESVNTQKEHNSHKVHVETFETLKAQNEELQEKSSRHEGDPERTGKGHRILPKIIADGGRL